MIRATLIMKVKAGREQEFERAWMIIAEQAQRTPGNIRQTLLRDQEDQFRFIITSDWESPEAFRSFEHSPEQDVLTAPLRELRESASMTVYNLLAHIEKEPHQ